MKYSPLFFITLILISGCFYDPYITHHRDNEYARVTHREKVYTWGYMTRDVDIWTLPDREKLYTFLNMLSHAKKRIWIEVYILTEKSTIASLIEAKNRGIDVRVILERNVYNIPFIHETLFRDLADAGIDVVWANSDAFTFTHAKFFLVDDTLFLSTGNLSYTSFTKNRDFIFVSHDPSDIALFESVFLADSKYEMVYPRSPIFLFSPTDARLRINSLFAHAKESITLSIQSLTDSEIIQSLVDAANRGIQVRICTNHEGTEDESTLTSSLSGTLVTVWFSDTPYIHAKLALIDTGTIFLGSMNFTANALDNNREAGLIITTHSGYIMDSLRETILHDCPFP